MADIIEREEEEEGKIEVVSERGGGAEQEMQPTNVEEEAK